MVILFMFSKSKHLGVYGLRLDFQYFNIVSSKDSLLYDILVS